MKTKSENKKKIRLKPWFIFISFYFIIVTAFYICYQIGLKIIVEYNELPSTDKLALKLGWKDYPSFLLFGAILLLGPLIASTLHPISKKIEKSANE